MIVSLDAEKPFIEFNIHCLMYHLRQQGWMDTSQQGKIFYRPEFYSWHLI